MTSDYRIVVGLEVHVQLLTRTKLFCGCSTQFGLPPNSATCPVCLGMPGSLPVMNRRAFELAVKAALALNCGIAPFTKWDRKNYWYPDLPKNYQISQYDLPFSKDGWLDIETATGPKRIGIIRAHLEEDAGKLVHDESGQGNASRVDLNRTGTPLVEIVSRPDLSSAEEAKTYLEEIRLMMRDLEVSDCEMQEGSLRCDANINLHLPIAGEFIATPIVEIKNLNSFRAVERALKYEAQRQYEEFGRTGVRLDKNNKATAGWDEGRGVTVIQRRKEEAEDYRYFPDPDLVPVVVDQLWIDRIKTSMSELPATARRRLQAEHKLSPYDAGVLTQQGRAFVQYFEEVARSCGDAKEASNWTTNQVLAAINERKISIEQFSLPAPALGAMIAHTRAVGLNAQRTREVFLHMVDHGTTVQQAIDQLGFTVVADENQLRDLVRQAIAANGKAVADYKKGKVKAADAIKGAVMRQTKGLAKMELVQRLMSEELEKT